MLMTTTEPITLTPAQIAAVVLERRLRMSPTVFQGEILDDLGSEGLNEALTRRWLVPDLDSGFLQVTNEDAKVIEMEALVTEAADEIASTGKLPDKPAVLDDPQAETRRIAIGHALRESTFGVGYTGAGAPTMGAGNSPAGAGAPARNPNPTPSATAGRKPPPEIESNVVVVENGKSYVGKVQSVTGEGSQRKYRISFGGEKPPRDREYEEKELGSADDKRV